MKYGLNESHVKDWSFLLSQLKLFLQLFSPPALLNVKEQKGFCSKLASQ